MSAFALDLLAGDPALGVQRGIRRRRIVVPF
jgi:hypothetical protein